MRKIIDKFIELSISVCIALMVIMVCWQVITRYVLGNPSTVTEEFLRYMLVWTTMLGAAYAYGRGKHLSIVFFVKKLSKINQYYVNILVQLITIAFSLIVLLNGGVRVSINAIDQFSAALNIPMQFIYFSVVVCGVLLIFYSLIFIKENLLEINALKNSQKNARNMSV